MWGRDPGALLLYTVFTLLMRHYHSLLRLPAALQPLIVGITPAGNKRHYQLNGRAHLLQLLNRRRNHSQFNACLTTFLIDAALA